MIGGLLSEAVRIRHYSAAGAAILATFNLFSLQILRVSDYGESNILISAFIIHFFGGEAMTASAAVAVGVMSVGMIYFFYQDRWRDWTIIVSLMVILAMNILVPFHPLRNPELKEAAAALRRLTNDQPVELYVTHNDIQSSLNTTLFYLPLGSRAENIRRGTIQVHSPLSSRTFCLVDPAADVQPSSILLRYDKFLVVTCRLL